MEYANSLTHFCRALVKVESMLEAEAVAMQAVSILEFHHANDSQLMGSLLYNLAEISVFHEDFSTAVKQLSIARSFADRYEGPESDSSKMIATRLEALEKKLQLATLPESSIN